MEYVRELRYGMIISLQKLYAMWRKVRHLSAMIDSIFYMDEIS